jgi:hypothetical protein
MKSVGGSAPCARRARLARRRNTMTMSETTRPASAAA